VIQDNSLKSIWVKNIGTIKIEETPDMRVMLLYHLKQTFKKIRATPEEYQYQYMVEEEISSMSYS
jgi:hypothetical protein